jgi:hypothetical protein
MDDLIGQRVWHRRTGLIGVLERVDGQLQVRLDRPVPLAEYLWYCYIPGHGSQNFPHVLDEDDKMVLVVGGQPEDIGTMEDARQLKEELDAYVPPIPYRPLPPTLNMRDGTTNGPDSDLARFQTKVEELLAETNLPLGVLGDSLAVLAHGLEYGQHTPPVRVQYQDGGLAVIPVPEREA